MEITKNISYYKGDCLIGMAQLPDASQDVVCADPPWKYLKNQRLEVDFDENAFFTQVKRILKDSGFIILFGRGKSFYRWNFMLDALGFEFKESMPWNKGYSTSPVLAISRIHEDCAIWTKKKGSIRRVKVPYIEARAYDFDNIIADINRIKEVLKKSDTLDKVNHYLSTGCRIDFEDKAKASKHRTSIQTNKLGDKVVTTFQKFEEGMNVKSIIRVNRDHYKTINPCQKPVKLMEQLIPLCADKGANVVVPFGGSGSDLIACHNLGMNAIAWELDSQYYTDSLNRVKEAVLILNT